MEGIEFEEEQIAPTLKYQTPSFLSSLVLRSGFAKSPEAAQAILLCVGAVLLLLAVIIFVIDWNTPQFESDVYPEGYLNDLDYMQKYGNTN